VSNRHTLNGFIRCGWLVKIGHSYTPNARFTQLKHDGWPSPVEPERLGFLGPIHYLIERQIRAAFEQHRVFGEWFVWCRDMERFIEDHCVDDPFGWGLHWLLWFDALDKTLTAWWRVHKALHGEYARKQ
jgi:hypothetical protein